MLLAAMLVGAILGGIIANNKGRNVFLWAVLCGVMPLILFVLFALPRQPQAGVWRPCPFCLSIVPWKATVCARCKNTLPIAQVHPCAYCGGPIWSGQDACARCGRKDVLQETENTSEKV